MNAKKKPRNESAGALERLLEGRGWSNRGRAQPGHEETSRLRQKKNGGLVGRPFVGFESVRYLAPCPSRRLAGFKNAARGGGRTGLNERLTVSDAPPAVSPYVTLSPCHPKKERGSRPGSAPVFFDFSHGTDSCRCEIRIRRLPNDSVRLGQTISDSRNFSGSARPELILTYS
jgi:hypothetical protein